MERASQAPDRPRLLRARPELAMPTTPKVVRARHFRRCERCRGPIPAREFYVSYVLFPADMEGTYEIPLRMSICADCDTKDQAPLVTEDQRRNNHATTPPLFGE